MLVVASQRPSAPNTRTRAEEQRDSQAKEGQDNRRGSFLRNCLLRTLAVANSVCSERNSEVDYFIANLWMDIAYRTQFSPQFAIKSALLDIKGQKDPLLLSRLS